MSYVNFQAKRARRRKAHTYERAMITARALQTAEMLARPQPSPRHAQHGDTWIESDQGATYFCVNLNGQIHKSPL